MDARVDKLIELVRKIVIRLFPELAGRYHLAARARVLSVSNGVQLQMLKTDGSEDTTAPALKVDPLPVKLKPGSVIRMGFMYGDPSEPFVVPNSTAAIGTMQGSQVNVENYGARDCLVAEHLKEHFRVATTTDPVDEDGNPLPGAITSGLFRIDYQTGLKDGDQVVALPIEEGERFIAIAKL